MTDTTVRPIDGAGYVPVGTPGHKANVGDTNISSLISACGSERVEALQQEIAEACYNDPPEVLMVNASRLDDYET